MRLIDADLLGLTDMEIVMCDGDYKEALKMLIDKIEHVTTIEPEQRWIPVTERLPERKGRYLVTRGNDAGTFWNGVYIVNYSDLMGLNKEKHWWTGDVGKSNFERILDVIAWMPLPEPYKYPDKTTAEELSNDIRYMATGVGVSIKQTAIYTSVQR